MSAYSALVLASSPNAYWRLGEPSGTVANSQVNNGTMVGSYSNTPTLGVTGALTGSGDSDTAVSFSPGTNQAVVANGATHQTLQDVGDVFTIEFWCKRASLGTTQTPYGNGGSGNSFCVRFDTDNTFRLDKESASVVVSSTSTVADTTLFHHIAVTKNGATSKLYLDGVDVTGVVTNATMANPTTGWLIAFDSNSTFGFDGVLDEVALYPTALSAQTVLNHFNVGSKVFAPAIKLTQVAVRRAAFY